MYSRTCPLSTIKTKQYSLFAQGNRALDNIPPSYPGCIATAHKASSISGGHVLQSKNYPIHLTGDGRILVMVEHHCGAHYPTLPEGVP